MTTWANYRTADVRSLFDAKSDACDSIQSQYAASSNMMTLVSGFARLVDPYDDIKTFYDELFNIMTVRGVGLDIWGEIVNVSRVIKLTIPQLLLWMTTIIARSFFIRRWPIFRHPILRL